MTHIFVVKLTIIGSDNGLSPGWRQAIIWTNAGILLIGPLGTNFIEILISIQTFSFKKMLLKMSSAKWRPFCLGLNVLIIMPDTNNFLCNNYITGTSHHYTFLNNILLYTTHWWQKQDLYSLSSKMSYHQISWSLEATRLDVIMIISLWNLTAAEVPVKFQSNLKCLNVNLMALSLYEILR